MYETFGAGILAGARVYEGGNGATQFSVRDEHGRLTPRPSRIFAVIQNVNRGIRKAIGAGEARDSRLPFGAFFGLRVRAVCKCASEYYRRTDSKRSRGGGGG